MDEPGGWWWLRSKSRRAGSSPPRVRNMYGRLIYSHNSNDTSLLTHAFNVGPRAVSILIHVPSMTSCRLEIPPRLAIRRSHPIMHACTLGTAPSKPESRSPDCAAMQRRGSHPQSRTANARRCKSARSGNSPKGTLRRFPDPAALQRRESQPCTMSCMSPILQHCSVG